MKSIDLLNADGLDDSVLGSSFGENTIKLRVKKSDIHGVGLFAETPIMKGTVIMPVIKIDEDGGIAEETEPQYYLNHSESNNVTPFKKNNVIFIKASEDIPKGKEVLGNYNDIHDLGLKTNLLNFKYYPDGYFNEIYKVIKERNPKKNRPEGDLYIIKTT